MRYFYIMLFLALPSYSANDIVMKSFNQLAKSAIYTVGGTLAGATLGGVAGFKGYIASTTTGLADMINDKNPYGYDPVWIPPTLVYSTVGGAISGGISGLVFSFVPIKAKAKSDVEKY